LEIHPLRAYSESIPASLAGTAANPKLTLGSNCMAKARASLACAALLIICIAPGSTQINSRDRILRAVDAADVAGVKGTAHPLARAQYDQGRTTPTRQLSGVWLTFRLSLAQQADLNQLLRQQQDPSSANYHKWLTPDQYAARFGMSSSDLAKVTSWLTSQGLTVDGVSRNHNEIRFSGSVGQVEYALKTEIHNYSVRGEQHFANAIDVSLPGAFAPEVLGVRGLNDFRPRPRVRRASPRFTSSISGNHFVIPGDLATIYNLGPLYSLGLDGSGQTIAVVGQTAVGLTDIAAFRSASGLPKYDPTLLLVPSTGTSATFASDLPEADLDIEWSGGVAKNAAIIYVYVGNNSTKTVFDALQYAIANNIAPVISISYGNCEANLGSTFVHTMQQWVQQANAQGQTVSGPSGDDGAADCDSGVTSATHGLAVDVPASIPEVTGVGGTEFTGDAAATVSSGCAAATTYWSGSCSTTSGASALSYIPETTWNDAVTPQGFSAGGGGASILFTKPAWQTGPGIPSDGKRDVPDISLNASNGHDPYLFCTSGSCVNGFRDGSNNLSGVGGTSVGAPSFAGILAIINQATQSSGQGNANPNLYSLAVSKPSAFHDVTSGNNNVPCTSGSTGCPTIGSIGFSAGANYDQVTGLGTINGFNLVTAWPAFSSSQSFAVGASPLTFTVAAAGQSGSTTVLAGGANGFTGTVSLTCVVPSTATSSISCAISPASIALDSTNTSATATLTINALASSAAVGHKYFAIFAAIVLLPAMFLLGSHGPKRSRGMVSLVVLALLAITMGCGGSGSPTVKKQTTPVTYAVTVTGTDSSSVSHSQTVNVTVD
jgi:subtilase family serine protease